MKNKILCLLGITLAIPMLSFAGEEKSQGLQLGFVDLFNGKDLENWVDVISNAVAKACKDNNFDLPRLM